ncbi:MAG: aspartate aminotransferase family protein [Proteobacteria bacterium]|nr:aspartate aminotransferase family protein [Pseudomonadota bacterium]NDE74884.1 aspartate aminotransferase family protein [Pseudomonadota bacterium]NDF54273.1 aspartate aminotransferase family protein [Pseudomonadota bacterium]NDF94744.1 aspartate aminotransferase family protein [Pseudomonadota bacterium]
MTTNNGTADHGTTHRQIDAGIMDPSTDGDLLRHHILDFRQMTQFAEAPWIFDQADGVRLRDTDGHWYIDGLSGVFVASLGYGNTKVIEAIERQLRTLHFAPPLHGTSIPALDLASRLRRLAPEAMQGRHGPGIKILSGGSEATEAALKLARQYWKQAGHPRKYKVIARYGGYHGATMGSLSATGGWERKSVFEPLVPGFLHHHQPHTYMEAFAHLPADEAAEAAGLMAANMVGRMIENEDPETVAAIIVEPMSISAAGFVVPMASYYRRLRELCDKHHVLLIYDEIITGFGRLGEWFGANFYGVAPDLLCCGKGMGGGYVPVSAVIIAGHVWEAFLGDPADRREFHHGHTFAGNPVASAAGCAAIDEMEARDLPGNAKTQGAYVRGRLQALQREFPDVICDVRGGGLLQGFEFDRVRYPKSTKPAKKFEAIARKHGFIARCGDEYVAFAPPLVIERADLDELLNRATDVLHEMVG